MSRLSTACREHPPGDVRGTPRLSSRGGRRSSLRRALVGCSLAALALITAITGTREPAAADGGGPRFIKGVNFNGNPVTVEGNQWLSYSQARADGLTVSNAITWTWTVPFNPAPSADVAHVLGTGIGRLAPPNGQGFGVAQTIPNGDYQVYLWMVENNADHYRDAEVRLEGVTAATNKGDLPFGNWERIGPYPVTVGDGVLNVDILRATKGDPLLCGMEIYGTGPEVAITNPSSGATLSEGSTVEVEATADDPAGVDRVEFFAGSTLLGSDDTAPYSATWSNLQAGSYTLTARAYSETGLSTTSAAVQVTVGQSSSTFVRGINLNGPAVVIEGNQWLSHAEATASGFSTEDAITWTWPIELTPDPDADTETMLGSGVGRLSPPNGDGFKMTQALPAGEYEVYLWLVENNADFYRDVTVELEGTQVAVGAGELPYGYWQKYGPYPVSVSDGALDIDILRESKGDPLVCGLAIYDAEGGNQKPAVQITAPVNGSTATAGSTVAITANASDPDGTIERVDFCANGNLLGSDFGSPYAFDWANVPVGTHTIVAKAIDNNGASTSSTAVQITVNAGGGSGTLGFVRGVNFNGDAVTIEGNEWLSYSQAQAAGLTVSNAQVWSYSVALTPTPTADEQNVLTRGLWRAAPPVGEGFSVAQPLTTGDYEIYLYTVENFQTSYRDLDVKLEGAVAAESIGQLNFGTWQKYGPYRVSVTDGTLNLDVLRRSKGDPLLCGMSIFSAAPQVQITSPIPIAVLPEGTPVQVTAVAQSSVGISAVEFYSGDTLLGTDTSAPYTLAWGTPAVGSYSLTAKATDTTGLPGFSAPVHVTVAPFVTGVNLNGEAAVVDGKPLLSHSAAIAGGMTLRDAITWNWPIAVTPSADSDTRRMLGSGIGRYASSNGDTFGLSQPIANGDYHVYVWAVENNTDYYRNANVRLEGNTVAVGIGDLPYSGWRKYGPYDVTVADGVLDLDMSRTSRGDPLLCGFAIYGGHAAAAHPVQVMPLGDSLTYGVIDASDYGVGGYRRPLAAAIEADGLSVDWIGSLKTGTNDFDRDHEGRNGWTIQQLSDQVEDWMVNWQPEVILLTAGVNDLAQGATPEVAAQRMDTLLNKLFTARPNAHVLLATLTPVKSPNSYVSNPAAVLDLNSRFPALAQAHAGLGRNIRLVDVASGAGLTGDDYGPDGLHLNHSGYQKVANVWHPEVKGEVKALR
ncbi:MAG: Ig-like domain-containing protein [Armatimonadota bacterium]